MSISGAICMAQESTVCGICEESSILKWICIECDLYLCQDCYVKFHSKSKTLVHHLVMDIKEYGTEQTLDKILKVKLKEINCDGSEHCDQKCSIFCSDCDKPICFSCVICHKYHDLHKLSEIFEQKMTKLKDLRVKSEQNISVGEHEEQELQVMLSKGSKQFDDTKTEILHNQKIYTDLIQKHFDNLLKDAENQWNLTRETINRELELIQRNIQQMEAQKKKIDQIFNPQKISEILTSNHSNISQILPSKSVYQMSLQQAKFIHGFLSKDSCDRCYYLNGRLYKGPHYKMIGSYSTKMRNLSKIIHLQNSSCIIANYNEELLQKVKFDSNEIKVENEIKTKVFDLAMIPDGRLLLSKETSDLELINIDGGKELFHSFSPFLTFGVCVHKEDLFVGVAKSLQKSVYQDGRIVLLDMKGQVKCTFGKEHKSGEPLFICPTRIAANSEIICVINTLKRNKDNHMLQGGRIVGLNHKGEEKWSYSDKSGAVTGRFYPQDITFTSAGLILACDYLDNSIHAINKDGDVTGWIDVQDIGFPMFPASLDVDDQGILWVGCGIRGSNEEVKTHKIYSFKFS
ncbi:E3 ubiquitin-protein ligase TRIM71-like [Mytilus edulis]|uniref:E3 ubiquitin-protein ligase TRIM71-like n=1 Tax=Mytilus edulis TaxID=6550 RepID=UPI0039EE562C